MKAEQGIFLGYCEIIVRSDLLSWCFKFNWCYKWEREQRARQLYEVTQFKFYTNIGKALQFPFWFGSLTCESVRISKDRIWPKLSISFVSTSLLIGVFCELDMEREVLRNLIQRPLHPTVWSQEERRRSDDSDHQRESTRGQKTDASQMSPGWQTRECSFGLLSNTECTYC